MLARFLSTGHPATSAGSFESGGRGGVGAADPGCRIRWGAPILVLSVGLVEDLADELLENVLETHDATRPAVLIEYDEEMLSCCLELP